jgi:hypothetical protein
MYDMKKNACDGSEVVLKQKFILCKFKPSVIFGRKRKEVVGSWTRLHEEELQNLSASPNIIAVIQSRRTRWMGHTARMEHMRNA